VNASVRRRPSAETKNAGSMPAFFVRDQARAER
jgi:hypothetical protein